MSGISRLEELTNDLVAMDRKLHKSSEELKVANKILHVVSESFARYIKREDQNSIFAFMLDEILKITESEYGFIGQVKYTENNKPYLHTKSITDISWNKETKKFYEENKQKGLKFENMNTLFGYGIVHGTTVISNNPSEDPRSCGIPVGHPGLNSFLGLPFFSNGKIIGQIGIANKPGGYNQSVADSLESFRVACSTIIEATIEKPNEN
jgi:hypothetical protein